MKSQPPLKNLLTIVNFRPTVITVRNNRVIFEETIQDYLGTWFHKGLLLKLTDSSKYREIKAVGIPLPVKKEIYC